MTGARFTNATRWEGRGMILKHEGCMVRRNDPGRAMRIMRGFGIWLATMAVVIACLAGVGILLAPASAEGPAARPFDTDNAGPLRQTTEGQCR